ncbi:zinc finger protein OZF [Biomphalaria pfeifferi]|uniref:Zinc finger protein OZF n=1 Tax=Biomphalaria pfeifferi TaxID=112525 RepID=A0AAD8FHU3_BIOPF|nr:zinc finger protein OZF [Biomphalaria pfeifferi]
MDDLKQDFSTEIKNIIKVEKKERSLHSETTENSFKSQTSKLILEEQSQSTVENRNGNQEMTLNQDILGRNTPNKDVHTGNLQAEEQNDSIKNKTYQLVLKSAASMDVLKQDLTTELKNMKIEKIEWSLHSEMTENSYMSQASELILEELTQKRNVNQEMTFNQDILARNTPNKDVHTGNFQAEQQNDSIENKTCQLLNIFDMAAILYILDEVTIKLAKFTTKSSVVFA